MRPTYAAGSLVENWSDINNWELVQGERYSLMPDDGLMGGSFLRMLSGGATLNGCLFHSKFYFTPGVPCSYKHKVRFHDDTGGANIWFGDYWYVGEVQYIGLGFPGGGGNTIGMSDGGFGGGPTDMSSVPYDQVHELECHYDGNLALSYYLNGVFVASRNMTYAFPLHYHVWLTGFFNNNATGHIDIGPITYTGVSDVYARVGDRAFLSLAGDFSDEIGDEVDGRQLDCFKNYGGGLTGLLNTATYSCPTPYETATRKSSYPYEGSQYKAGNFDAQEDTLTLPAGMVWDKAELWGLQRDGGTLAVSFWDADTGLLVPDAELPGNSTGISVVGWPSTLDLKPVTATHLYYKAAGTNTGVVSPIIAKGIIVSFKPEGNMRIKHLLGLATDKVALQDATDGDVNIGLFYNFTTNGWEETTPPLAANLASPTASYPGYQEYDLAIATGNKAMAMVVLFYDSNSALINSYPLFLDANGNRITADEYYGIQTGGNTVNITPFQGSVSYAGPVATKSTVRMIEGDTATLKAAIKQSGGTAFDLTGWTVTWAVKKSFADTTYIVGPRDITADVESPATGGIIDINFLAADTSALSTGLYYGEIQITKGAQVLTPWQCNLYVDPAVIH